MALTGNTIDLVLKASNQASPALTQVAGQLGALDLAGRKAAGGGLKDIGAAIPTIAGSLLSLASAIPGPIGMLAQLGSATVGHLSKMSAEADATLQRMTALSEGIQATFEETQAAVARIRAEAAGNVGQVVQQQYAQELAAIDKAYAKQVAAAKGNALQLAAIEAESAGKRLIAHAQYEAELSKLSQKRLELAKQLGTQVRDAETSITQALLEEQGKRIQALDVGAARQTEILKEAHQKQLAEIEKLGGTASEQDQLRRAAQEAFEAKSLQQTTETEIKRRAILKQQGEFLADLAKSAGAAEASLAVAVADSQGKQVTAVEAASAQKKAILDADYQAVLKRITEQGLTEQQALAARLSAERAYHAQSQQLAVESADQKAKLIADAAAKEAEATAKATADRQQRDDKAFAQWIDNLKAIAAGHKMVAEATAAAASAEAEATASIQEGYGKQLEALERMAERRQQIIEETYAAEIQKAEEATLTITQRQALKLAAEKKYSEESIRLSAETEQRRVRIVEESVQGSLRAMQTLGTGWEGIQSKLTMANFITETQKGIQALTQLGTAVLAGDETLKRAGLTTREVEAAIAGLTQKLTTAVTTGVIPGTQAVQQNTAANTENAKVLSDGTRILSEQQASWARLGDSINGATEKLTSWAVAEAAAKGKAAGGGGAGGGISTPVPSWVKTAQDFQKWAFGGQASITPASQFGPKTTTPTNRVTTGGTNNVNVNVGSVNDKQTIQTLVTLIMNAIADAERRRTG